MSNRIHLKGIASRQEEALAHAAITPGDLIALNAAGKVLRHATAGGVAERAFALEDALQGRGIGTDYAADDVVTYILAVPGDEVLARIAADETIVKGDKLSSAGNGLLVKQAAAAVTVAIAMAATDVATVARIPVRVV